MLEAEFDKNSQIQHYLNGYHDTPSWTLCDSGIGPGGQTATGFAKDLHQLAPRYSDAPLLNPQMWSGTFSEYEIWLGTFTCEPTFWGFSMNDTGPYHLCHHTNGPYIRTNIDDPPYLPERLFMTKRTMTEIRKKVQHHQTRVEEKAKRWSVAGGPFSFCSIDHEEPVVVESTTVEETTEPEFREQIWVGSSAQRIKSAMADRQSWTIEDIRRMGHEPYELYDDPYGHHINNYAEFDGTTLHTHTMKCMVLDWRMVRTKFKDGGGNYYLDDNGEPLVLLDLYCIYQHTVWEDTRTAYYYVSGEEDITYKNTHLRPLELKLLIVEEPSFCIGSIWYWSSCSYREGHGVERSEYTWRKVTPTETTYTVQPGGKVTLIPKETRYGTGIENKFWYILLERPVQN